MLANIRIEMPRLRTALILLVLGWLFLCRPWFMDHQVIPWDSKDAFYPNLHFVAQSIRHGEMPGWNPFVYSGHPIISDPQAMIFSPLAVLAMAATSHPSIYWFDGMELVHVLLAGVGMLLLSVQLGRSTLAGLFTALVYMYGGSASGRLEHVPMILAYSYFPFALLALEHAMATKRLRSAAAFGVLAGILAAHQNQAAYLFCLVLLGYVVYRAASASSLRVFCVEHWRIFTVALCSGIVTLAIPFYLTLQFLPLSNRQHIDYAYAVGGSMNPLTLMTLFIRNFFANGRLERYWGFGDVVTTFLYAGTLTIVLVVRYGILHGNLLDRQIRFFLYVGVASVLYALGNFTPFYWVVYHVVPGVALYRRPADASFIINMVLAVFAGFLIDHLLAGRAGRIRASTLLLGGIPLLSLFVFSFLYAAQQHKLPGLTRDVLFAVLFVSVSLWLLHAIASSRSQRSKLMLAWAVVFLLVTDIAIHLVGTDLNGVSYPHPELMQDASEKEPLVRFLHDGLNSMKDLGAYRADITVAGNLWGNAPMVLDIQSSQGYNPLRYLLYDRVAGAPESVGATRPFSPLLPTYNAPMLNLLGVKYIVSKQPIAEIDPKVQTERFPLVFEQDGVRVWQNSEALPRVLAATSLYIEPDLEGAIVGGKMARLDYRSTVVLSHLPATLAGLNGPANSVIPLPGQTAVGVRLTGYGNNRVAVSVESARDAIVVLNDLYYPAWRVYVDGQERELLQANYMFRGVHVRPGEHLIVFRFEPFSGPAFKGTFQRLFAASSYGH